MKIRVKILASIMIIIIGILMANLTVPVYAASLSEPHVIIAVSSLRALSNDDISGLSSDELRIAINEIYARHGRQFSDQTLQAWFNAQAWYVGNISPANFSEDLLSKVEKDNISLMREKELKSNTTNDSNAVYGVYNYKCVAYAGGHYFYDVEPETVEISKIDDEHILVRESISQNQYVATKKNAYEYVNGVELETVLKFDGNGKLKIFLMGDDCWDIYQKR